MKPPGSAKAFGAGSSTKPSASAEPAGPPLARVESLAPPKPATADARPLPGSARTTSQPERDDGGHARASCQDVFDELRTCPRPADAIDWVGATCDHSSTRADVSDSSVRTTHDSDRCSVEFWRLPIVRRIDEMSRLSRTSPRRAHSRDIWATAHQPRGTRIRSAVDQRRPAPTSSG